MKINEALKKQNLRMLSAFWIGLIFLFLVFQYAVFHLEKTFHQKALEVWIGENKSKLSELVFVENTLALKNIIATPPVFSESLNKVSIFDLTGNALVNQNNFANSFLNIKEQNSFGFNTTIFPPKVIYFSDLKFAGKNQGYLYLESFLSEKTLFINTVILILMFLGFYLYYRFLQARFNDLLNQEIIDPVLYLSNQMNQGQNVDNNFILNKPDEFVDLYLVYNNMLSRLKTLSEQNEIRIREAVSLDMAKQVAHDIRSPLSALNMVSFTLDQIPEERRLLIRNAIQRINDIANTLLQKSKTGVNLNEPLVELVNDESQNVKLKIELLPALMDTIVSEKRVQFRNQVGVNIDIDLASSYGAFVKVDASILKRMMSNLINNSIEAFDNQSGKVLIKVKKEKDQILVLVSDNGKGIPSGVLKKLGEMGVSHGKAGTQSGSGLGLYHAKKAIESFSGKIQIESKENQGTTITISLPSVIAPDWFVEALDIDLMARIVSVDDDLSIHGIWKGRFGSLGAEAQEMEHLSFTSGESFKKWYIENQQQELKTTGFKRHNLFLMDFELLNQPQTGLELIEELKIADNSILITSRYEEEKIQERCHNLGLKLIPKTMAGFVPIKIKTHHSI